MMRHLLLRILILSELRYDASFEATYLFSLLGLTVSLALLALRQNDGIAYAFTYLE